MCDVDIRYTQTSFDYQIHFYEFHTPLASPLRSASNRRALTRLPFCPQAVDPEGDPVTYTMVEGTGLDQFTVGRTTGTISVARTLDREQLSKYNLVISGHIHPAHHSLVCIACTLEVNARTLGLGR